MADDEIYEIISAFVLGCMDNENYARFKNYSDNNGKLPLKDFSAFQNIVALIPTMLDITKPDSKLKDAVAKNILSYQEEIKGKIRAKKTATISADKTSTKTFDKQNKSTAEISVSANNLLDKFASKLNKKTAASIAEQTTNETQRDHSSSKKGTNKDKKQLTLETNGNKQPSLAPGKSKFPWIIFLSILILTIAGSIYFYLNSNNLQNEILKLNREIVLLKAQLRKETNFVSTNKKVVDFLNYNELDIVNLEKRDNSMDASGKILISFGKQEALLEAENLPSLPEGKVFQLWLITKDISYSLLTFTTSPGKKFYSMPKLPYVSKNEVDLIRITVEPDSGSEYPTGNTILFGGFKK